MTKDVEAVIDKIKQFRIEKNMSIVRLSAESGISRSHLFYIETKRTVPSLETLSRIASAMQLQLKDFFV
ncbi:MAG: helix-turn-helix domain-containing protein [Treponema sp.]